MTLYMPFFRACTTLRCLTQLHSHLLVTGLHGDPLPATKLIESYAQLGCLRSSRLVFDTFPSTADSFMWGVLIKSHVWSRSFDDAVGLYHRMVAADSDGAVEVSRFIYPSVLRACSCCRDHHSTGEKVHGRIVKCGFDSDDVIRTCLLSLYGEMGSVSGARKLFDEMSDRDTVCWSSIISVYIDNGDVVGGLDMFRLMISRGVSPDSVTMLSLAEACAELGLLRLARSIHCQAMARDINIADESLNSSLIFMYSKCGDLASAERLFRSALYRSTVSWTAMISSYNQGGQFQDAIGVFLEMQWSSVGPNSVTLMALLFSCSGLRWLRGGKSVHCFIIRNSMDPKYDFLGPPLVEFYADCGRLQDSEKVFHSIEGRDVVSWNMLIAVYARKGLLDQALLMFGQMLTNRIMPDSFSLATSLSACGNLGLIQIGREIHGHVVRVVGSSNEFVQNALIDMYSKCGHVDWAHNLFMKAYQRSVVTCNSMICGFSQNGYLPEAIKLFDQMYSRRLHMNEVTFLIAIQVCSNLAYIEKGRWLHHKLITCGIGNDVYVDTALLDMYAKCGDQRTARIIFDHMPEKSVVSWSAMIAGYGIHGQVNSALSVFNEMIELGIQPNKITFMNILSTCSHAGYVEKGKFFFELMKECGVEPDMEHVACLVDLLSRSGNLDDAYSVIRSMQLPANAGVWSSFLNGCRIHRRVDLFLAVKRNLVKVETRDAGYFSLLSNIFAEEENWGESGKLRSVMESKGLKKVRGYSLIGLG